MAMKAEHSVLRLRAGRVPVIAVVILLAALGAGPLTLAQDGLRWQGRLIASPKNWGQPLFGDACLGEFFAAG